VTGQVLLESTSPGNLAKLIELRAKLFAPESSDSLGSHKGRCVKASFQGREGSRPVLGSVPIDRTRSALSRRGRGGRHQAGRTAPGGAGNSF